jgi:hypothetical protein
MKRIKTCVIRVYSGGFKAQIYEKQVAKDVQKIRFHCNRDIQA